MSFNSKSQSSFPGLALGLSLLLVSQFACTPSYTMKRPQFGGKSAAESEVKVPTPIPQTTPEAVSPVPAIPVSTGDVTVPTPVVPIPAVPKSIAVTEAAGLKLGLKAPQGCADAAGAKSMGLGAYINFEVLEDNTQVTLSLARLCGDLSQKNAVTLMDASGKVLGNQLLGSKEISTKTQVFGSSSLAKGRYTVAIETAGSSIDSVASIFVGGALLEGTKGIKLESLSEF